ncbi:hypothetical protein GCM10010924_26320 [Rhizobium wenxiniae]|nr:hypothetical protein GCM10010924_26320 [Rhizobium wenxiniae]
MHHRRRLAEMPRGSKRLEIAHLAKCEHDKKFQSNGDYAAPQAYEVRVSSSTVTACPPKASPVSGDMRKNKELKHGKRI